jgi:hypothetical protein
MYINPYKTASFSGDDFLDILHIVVIIIMIIGVIIWAIRRKYNGDH